MLQKAGSGLAGQLLRGRQATCRCQLAADITSACFKAAAGQARPAAAAGAATAALQRASPGILEHITPKEPEPVP